MECGVRAIDLALIEDKGTPYQSSTLKGRWLKIAVGCETIT